MSTSIIRHGSVCPWLVAHNVRPGEIIASLVAINMRRTHATESINAGRGGYIIASLSSYQYEPL
jgi:hypothetical protein